MFLSNALIQANLNVDASFNLTHTGFAIRIVGNANDTAVVSNSWIDSNLGCGLGLTGVQAFISQSTFSRNGCVDPGSALGVTGAAVEVVASSILDNIGAFPAVRLDGGSLLLESSTVAANQATTMGEAGGVRLRPWSIRWATVAQLDEMAASAGLHVAERWADYERTPFGPDSPRHVTVYRR